MTITEAPATKVFMPLADILALTSFDAEVEMDNQRLGFSHRAPLTDITVADVLVLKYQDIASYPYIYEPVIDSMRANGQTATLHVTLGYLFNGHHRVAIALMLGWEGMWVSDDAELAEDQGYDELHPRTEDGLAR